MFLPAYAPLPTSRRIEAPGHDALRAAWPDVRVLSLERRRVHGRRDPRVSLSACIDLAGLLPVDVLVTLVPPRGRADVRERRMFSVQPYGNGAFRFAASVDARLLRDDDEWAVRVAPAVPIPAHPELRPVLQTSLPRACSAAEALDEEPGALTE